METKFDRVYLEKSSIFELRNIGRDIGVKCPTSKSKDQLVGEIMDIINGVIDPFVPAVRRGRPPKNMDVAAQTEILNTIVPSRWYDNVVMDEQTQYESLSNFIRQYQKDAGDDYSSQNEIDVLGYLDLIDNYGYVLDKNDYSFTKVIYFPDSKIKEYNLRKGDLIYARGKVIHPKRPTLLTKVVEINDRDKIPPRQLFENMEFGNFKQEFKVFAELIRNEQLSKLFPLIQGSRNIVKMDNATSELYNLAKVLSRTNNTKVIFLSVIGLPEYRSFLKDEENLEVLFTQFDRSTKETLGEVDVCIERVKRLAELGYNVVLMVDGLDKVISCCDASQEPNVNAGQYMRNLFALARVLRRNTVTVIGTIRELDNRIKDIASISRVID